MPIYEEYETGHCRRIDDMEEEQRIRRRKGYGFFRLAETDRDLGEVTHTRDVEEARVGGWY